MAHKFSSGWFYNKSIVYPDDSPMVDAFGRQRVSNITSLFDGKLINDSQALRWDDQEVSGGSTTSTYNTNKASVTLAVGATTAGKRVRQTFRRFNYVPAKSQLAFLTFTLGAQTSGVSKAVGLFDDQNGIFFEDTGSIYRFGIRTYTSGSAVDTTVDQSSWNVDKFDGYGPSGVVLDFTKSQIMHIDYEWLGVGRLRIGFVINGTIYYAHYFDHANVLAGVYMSTPNLPARYEIENDGTGEAASLECICCSVASEGGADPIGEAFGYVRNPLGSITSGTTYALLGARLKSGYEDAVIQFTDFVLAASSQSDLFKFTVRINPTVAGTFTYSDVTNSALQVAEGAVANTVTGGTIVRAGIQVSQTTVINDVKSVDNSFGTSIDGTSSQLVLCITPLAAAMSIGAAVNWRELG